MAKRKKAAVSNAGRPEGAKTGNYETAEVVATQCNACSSSNREPYFGKIERGIAGVLSDGREYSHVVWRRTRCRDCGQARIDRSYENRKGKK